MDIGLGAGKIERKKPSEPLPSLGLFKELESNTTLEVNYTPINLKKKKTELNKIESVCFRNMQVIMMDLVKINPTKLFSSVWTIYLTGRKR